MYIHWLFSKFTVHFMKVTIVELRNIRQKLLLQIKINWEMPERDLW